MKFSFSFGAQDFVSMLVGVWGCGCFFFVFCFWLERSWCFVLFPVALHKLKGHDPGLVP